ncbi:hypothetical protein MJ575_24415 [Klebsiella pneumoniae]|nr:hypothetical protein MJ575_24415 [Klebsiella pneumoniae]
MYDVSGAQPVNVTDQLLLGKLNALSNEMIVYKAPKNSTSSPSSPILPAATVINCTSR